MKPFHKPYFPLVFLWFCLLRFCYFIQTYSTVTAFFNVLLNDFTWVMTTESAIFTYFVVRAIAYRAVTTHFTLVSFWGQTAFALHILWCKRAMLI